MGITPAFNRLDAYTQEATYLYINCACVLVNMVLGLEKTLT